MARVHTLRTATADDVPFLVDVVVAATHDQGRLPSDFDEEAFRAGFATWTAELVAGADPGCTTSVVEVDGRAVGRLRVVRSPTTLELAGLQLLPEAQAQGIGSQVVADLVDEAAESGRCLTLSVELDNPRARALYVRLGFVETARTDDEIVMVHQPPARSRPFKGRP